jgi:hypothetical protein
MRSLVCALCAVGAALALVLIGSSVNAQQPPPPCDFVTGGGYIFPPDQTTQQPTSAKGTFGAAGGCRNASGWGHLEYDDHGLGLKVRSTSITGYVHDSSDITDRARLICGNASTNQGDVTFVVRVRDAEPGSNGEFDIQLQGAVVYSTCPAFPHELGGSTSGGGHILLHKPNAEVFSSCPAFCAGVNPCPDPTAGCE